MFAAEILPFLSRINRSLNFLESDRTNGVSYFGELEDLFCFALEKVTNKRTDENRFARSMIISILEQVCQKRIDQRGEDMICRVPKRFTRKDISAVWLNPETTLCDWPRAFEKMDTSDDPLLLKAKELLKAEFKKWPGIAKEWIEDTAYKMFDDNEIEDFDDLIGNFELDSQEARFQNRRGLGEPKNKKTINDELSEYQCVNWNDIANNRMFCENNNISSQKAGIEFWRRYSSSLPKLAQIGKQVFPAILVKFISEFSYLAAEPLPHRWNDNSASLHCYSPAGESLLLPRQLK